MIRISIAPICALMLIAGVASARAQDIPATLLGTYASGPEGCAAPQMVVHLTPRSVVTWKTQGEAKLIRISESRMVSDWLVTVGTRDDMPRTLVRLSGEAEKAGIDIVFPFEKTRDDQLPGNAPVMHLVRCTALPSVFSAIHGEGIAFLHALETMEPPCSGNNIKLCGDAFMAYADVNGDHRLTAAELSRVARGATWAAQMAGGTNDFELVSGLGASMVAGLAVAEVIVHSYDYDGSGSVTIDELLKDRLAIELVPRSRSVDSPPIPLERLLPSGNLLRDLMRIF